MPAEAPLFLMYTSGTTGRPKGCVHSTGGYMSYVAGTSKYYQDIHPDDVYWCMADIGWITGHSYIVYGPLGLGTTTVIYEGVPNYPDGGRPWRIAEKLGDRIQGSRIHHLKELRPGSAARSEIRVLFAFDPTRWALLLLGGDKAGNWQRWYKENIPIAERLYLDYTTEAEE